MKTVKIKKHLTKLKKKFAPKISIHKFTKTVTSRIDRTYKKLSTKRKKVKKLKKVKTTTEQKAQKKLREQIAKHKHKEKIAKIQAIKIRNHEKQRIKDEELKIKKQELRLKEEELKLKITKQK